MATQPSLMNVEYEELGRERWSRGDPEDCDDTLGYIATLYLHYIILHFTFYPSRVIMIMGEAPYNPRHPPKG